MTGKTELDEIRHIEETARLDREIVHGHVLLRDLLINHPERTDLIRQIEAGIGEMLAYRTLLGVSKRR